MKTVQLCDYCDGEGEVMEGRLYPAGHTEVIVTCPECEGERYLERNINMDTITLLQIDAGCNLYKCTYTAKAGASSYVFKSFDTYEPGDFAFVSSAGTKSEQHVSVVRVEGEGEFSEDVERYRWLGGKCILPDLEEGERIDAAARRKIAIGEAIAAAKASASGLSVNDYIPESALKLSNNGDKQ